MKRKPRGVPKSLRRGHGSREPLPAMLVVCEGKTEAQLIEQLRGRWRIPSVKVVVCAQVGVPKTVVQRGKEEQERHFGKRRAKHPPHQVWVVFDRDQHDSWLGAIGQARDLRYRLACSNPCFELWGLLLHRDQRAHIHRHAAQRELSKLHVGYDHDESPFLDAVVVEKHYEQANERARALSKQAIEDGKDYRNPTTLFGELVAALAMLRI